MLTLITTKLKFSKDEESLAKKYSSRLAGSKTLGSFRWIQLSKNYPSLELESAATLSLIKQDDYLVVLDQRGLKFNNQQIAERLQHQIASGSSKNIVFVVGGAYGISEQLKKRADLIWSFSDQVFPHRLFIIMLLEQIYRSLTILEGSPYHH